MSGTLRRGCILILISRNTEASRAKHKFAAKRNCWPRTRGVAMNPVDHVRASAGVVYPSGANDISSLTVVVTISTLVRLRRCRGTLLRVRKSVLLLPGEPVCSVVPRRPRNRWAMWDDIVVMGFKNAILVRFIQALQSSSPHWDSLVCTFDP